MTITSSGVKCDVCGRFILLEDYYPFTLTGIDQELHADKKCLEIIKSIDKNNGGDGDWTKLPDGPLKDVFKDSQEEK